MQAETTSASNWKAGKLGARWEEVTFTFLVLKGLTQNMELLKPNIKIEKTRKLHESESRKVLCSTLDDNLQQCNIIKSYRNITTSD